MSDESSGIQVGAVGEWVLIRVEGKGTHLNSHLLKQYLLQCLNENYRRFLVDLSQCCYMDSTFLGMLAGFGIKVKERSLPPVRVVKATERVRGMFQSLGIDHFFEITQETLPSGSLSELPSEGISKETKTLEILESHEKLAEISGANEVRFRDVIALLRKKVGDNGAS